MSEIEQQNFAGTPRNRRAVVKGAAWSVPVIAAAIAAPAASASVANAGLVWSGSTSSLAQLRVLDSATVVTAGVLPTLPTAFTISNGPGAITADATVTISVGRPAGVTLAVGRARGFGVYSYNGAVTPPSSRTVAYQQAPLTGIQYGYPTTSYTAVQPVSVASNGQVIIPVEFALAGVTDLLALNVLTAFPVTLTLNFGDGNVYTASSSISVPVGAGVL